MCPRLIPLIYGIQDMECWGLVDKYEILNIQLTYNYITQYKQTLPPAQTPLILTIPNLEYIIRSVLESAEYA